MKITKATIVEYRRNMERRWQDKEYYGLAFTPEYEAINWAIYNCPKKPPAWKSWYPRPITT